MSSLSLKSSPTVLNKAPSLLQSSSILSSTSTSTSTSTSSSSSKSLSVPSSSSPLPLSIAPALLPSSSSSSSSPSSFHLIVTGQIESANNFAPHIENLYCRYVLSYGPDWKVVHGVSTGITQIAQSRNRGDVHIASQHQHQHQHHHHHYSQDRHHRHYGDHGTSEGCLNSSNSNSGSGTRRRSNNRIVWNFPIELAFRSTNVHGWPRISLAVYGPDFFGRDVVRGYGSILIPPVPGPHDCSIGVYRPISGSLCHELMNWINGTLPEYYETSFTARSEGRATTRVNSDGGEVRLILNVATKDMQKFGFDCGAGVGGRHDH